MLRLGKPKHNGRPRVLPWKRTFNGKVVCLRCHHRTLTYEGFRSHYYRLHRNRVPLVSRYSERPENRGYEKRQGGVLLGFLRDLPETIATLREAKEAYLTDRQDRPRQGKFGL